MLDQRTVAAEVDGTLAAVITVVEAIVRAKGKSVAAAPGGVDRALAGKQVGAGGKQDNGWVFGNGKADWQPAPRRIFELVNRLGVFHFFGVFGKEGTGRLATCPTGRLSWSTGCWISNLRRHGIGCEMVDGVEWGKWDRRLVRLESLTYGRRGQDV